MHFPGQGYGLVKTVTGATPLSVRTGFMRSFSTKGDFVPGPIELSAQVSETLDDFALGEKARAILRVAPQDRLVAGLIEEFQNFDLGDEGGKLLLVDLGLELKSGFLHFFSHDESPDNCSTEPYQPELLPAQE